MAPVGRRRSHRPGRPCSLLLDREVALVSVQLANHETGVIQPLRQIARLVRRLAPSAVLHTDAVQAAPGSTWRRWPPTPTWSRISGHKLGGPQGDRSPGRPRGVRPCAPSCTAEDRSGSCAAAPTTWPESSDWVSPSRSRRRDRAGARGPGAGAARRPGPSVTASHPRCGRDGRRRAEAPGPFAPAPARHRERGRSWCCSTTPACAPPPGRPAPAGRRAQPGSAGHGRSQGGCPFEPSPDPGSVHDPGRGGPGRRGRAGRGRPAAGGLTVRVLVAMSGGVDSSVAAALLGRGRP